MLDRVLDSYPRAFDVVLGDAPYADSRTLNYLLKRGNDIIAVHHPTAMVVLGRLAMICLMVSRAFYTRNLKPAVRGNVSLLHLSRLILAELYRAIPAGPPRTPMERQGQSARPPWALVLSVFVTGPGESARLDGEKPLRESDSRRLAT